MLHSCMGFGDKALVLAGIRCSRQTPEGPRTQIVGFQGPKTNQVWILGPETLLFGYLDPLGATYSSEVSTGASDSIGHETVHGLGV